MRECVKVEANARLHLGFFDLNGGLGRRFGSLGLAIDQPTTVLSVTRAALPSCQGPEHRRVAGYIDMFCASLRLPNSYAVTIDHAIPAHAGLGSGTQLALAVAAAVRQLEGYDADAAADAILLRRGARSGAGAALFRNGGLVVDGGHAEAVTAVCGKHVPPILTRLPFPDDWRIILVFDDQLEGVHGEAERHAFAQLPAFSSADAGEICRSVLMQALPAAIERDLAAFGAAIARIQRILGDYFAPAQGGSGFTSPRVGALMQKLAAEGAQGIGQSSWGPTGFAFAQNAAEAERLVGSVAAAAAQTNLRLLVCRGLNRGAAVTYRGNDHS
jgi:beta-ribofuranosylaminobenzene 5'-phosphate synthase